MMEVLTTAANVVFLGNDKSSIPNKNMRSVLSNISNVVTLNAVEGSSLNSLFVEAIKSKPKDANMTPRKRKKNSIKYGDENLAPSPKTPKNICQPTSIESPMTPMSNLKLLTRVASMEDHMPSKKILFQPSKIVPQTRKVLRRCISENASIPIEKSHSTNVKLKRHSTSSDLDINNTKASTSKNSVLTMETSRREKSLGLLCERFLEHFPLEVSCLETPRRLVIDDVASILGTERRRVYDIVNILECLNMASRVQKNMYQWMGKQHLVNTLSRLMTLAQQWGIGVHLNTPIEQSLKELKNENPKTLLGTQDKADARKEKSLGVLCQKFLMLFLTSSPPHTIQLDTAIHLLLGKEGDDLEKLRTRGRRIYDIANVLISLQIIKKLSKSFTYIGPKVEAAPVDLDYVPGGQQIRLRHSLLPPMFNVFANYKSIQHINDDTVVTPENGCQPVQRKGRGRKLTEEYISKAKRNCLPHTQSELSLKEGSAKIGLTRHLSLQDICQVAEVEREKLLRGQSVFRCNKNLTCRDTLENEKFSISKGNIKIHLPRFTSPRMALTFQKSSTSFSPTLFTNKPSTLNAITPKAVLKPQAIINKVYSNSLSNTVPVGKLESKPVYVIHTVPTSSQSGVNSINLNAGQGMFKVYSKNVEKVAIARDSLTNKSKASETASISRVSAIRDPNIKPTTPNSLPYISLNTVARSRYKTVFGCEAQIPNRSLSSDKQGSYHFVINTKDSKISSTSTKNSTKDNLNLTFVKMFHPSPDNSSTDSELDTIFGDAFNFTRPKSIMQNSTGK